MNAVRSWLGSSDREERLFEKQEVGGSSPPRVTIIHADVAELEDAPGSEPGGPKGLWGFDSLRPHSIKRVWRSWQTRRSEGPVEVTLRVGSTPTTRTICDA